MAGPISQGGCLCGAIRYTVCGQPLVSAVCHCRTCRKTASAPVLPFVTFPRVDFALTQGSPTDFHSSPEVTRSFCGHCGSPLTYTNNRQPDHIDIMTCSLDDPEAFPPACHIWASQRLRWMRLADGLPVHEKDVPNKA